jgi:hypothetical protein
MTVNGKSKGSQFERDISKTLSLWISNGSNANLLWRSQSSGGRATISAAKGVHLENQDGDISSTHEDSAEFSRHFVIECKFYKSLGLEQLVFRGTGPLQVFWFQVLRDSERTGKIPLLIAKQNNRPIILLTTARLGKVAPSRSVYFSHSRVYLFDFTEFLSWNYESVIQHLRNETRPVLLRRRSSSSPIST